MGYRPIFKNHEVVVRLLKNDIKLSSQEMEDEMEAEIVFIGAKCEDYKVGEKVLVNKNMGKPFHYTKEENLFRFPLEKVIICGLE